MKTLLRLFTSFYLLVSGLLFFTTLPACWSDGNGKNTAHTVDTIPKPPADITLPGSFSSQTKLKFDSSEISTFLKTFPQLISYEKEMRRFYRKRNYAFAWFDQQGLIEQAGNLYNKIETIADEGVPVQLLYEPQLHQMMDDDSAIGFREQANPKLELMLTAQYFFYAKHIWTGLGTRGMKAVDWDLPRKKLSFESLLDSLLEAPSSGFMKTEPQYPQYTLLKKHLKLQRQIQQQGGFVKVVADKKSYRLGDSGTTIRMIRKRLLQSGDIASDNGSAVYDRELEQGIKIFQRRYGLREDGIAGKNLLAEMNYPVEKRIEQIIVNMERCRWLPVAMRKDYFVVNIPEFRFHAYENEQLAWSMKVVVGKVIHQTAIFNGTMKYVVFAPYWNVPPGILRKEILPDLRRNRNYLEENHMEWYGNSVRQKPGPWNALGKVKFLFPNSHNIYLHDTPAKSLFEQDRRAFSHGCIRVEQPRKLAQYVLRHQPEWTEQRIDSAMNGDKELYVTLKQPIPVLIAYFTAWVDQDGYLNFRNDLYKKDSRLAQMIMEQSKL
jgi:murein L,D-transpeptidase YcbB/YkuD